MVKVLTADELNSIAKSSGYTGGAFSSVGLPTSSPAQAPTVAPSQPIQVQTPKPVSILSTDGGVSTLNSNTQSLGKIESGYMGPSVVDFLNSTGASSDFNSRSNLAKNNGIENYTGSADQNTQLLGALRKVSSSPASTAMVDSINSAVSSGGLTSTERNGLTSLQTTQDDLTTAAAKARAALESKDYTSMDYWTAKAEAGRKKFEEELSAYYTSTKDLRSQLTASMTPTEKENKLTEDLNSVRSQADAFKLQTEKDKLHEFEGQTNSFAGGRANEIDKNASFKMQELALKEKNLLLSLGLEQDARKYKGTVAAQGLTYLKDDFDLQSRVEDKINAEEDKVAEKASSLQSDAKSTLLSIMDKLQGVDPEHLDATSLNQLETIAARSGIAFSLVKDALKTQYNKQVFENSIKTATANKQTDSQKNDAAVVTIGNQLTAISNKSSDGYTDPNLYAKLRASSTLSASDFDNRFGYLVNPESKKKLGLSTTNENYSKEQITQTIHQQMATPAWKTASDDQKKNYILSLGGDPADFGF